jgi:hypothetical protein
VARTYRISRYSTRRVTPYTETMKTKEEILSSHGIDLKYTEAFLFHQAVKAMEEYAQQCDKLADDAYERQLSALQQENEKLRAQIHKTTGKSCPNCLSDEIVMFTADLDMCNRCGQKF